MGFNKIVGTTGYDMVVYLTPLGIDKFYKRGLMNEIKYFSISDHDVNYTCYNNLF